MKKGTKHSEETKQKIREIQQSHKILYPGNSFWLKSTGTRKFYNKTITKII